MCRCVDLLILSMWSVIIQSALAHGFEQSRMIISGNGDDSELEDENFRQFSRHRWRSVEKCKEYVRVGGQTRWVMPLSASRPIPVFFDCKNLVNALISGSELAEPGEFPHMAAVGWMLQGRRIGYFCGGALISDRWVLTAAHCTHGPRGTPVMVRLGSNRLSDNDTGLFLKIESITRHPDYSPPSLYADLALLKLARKVHFRPTIRPACLHTEFDGTPRNAWVSGWGATAFKEEPSDHLAKAELEIIENVKCSLMYNSTTSVPVGVVPSMICAGDPAGGWKKDTCRGDSGGPLQSLHSSGCLYEVIGVTSFGKQCGISGLPGVYTRVSHYINWIESVVWPEND